MDLTLTRSGEAKTVSTQSASGAPGGAVPIAEPSGRRSSSKALTDDASKEDRKLKADKINFDLFEQIAVERSEIAFSEFYDRFSPRVYALLRRLSRTQEDALDLLQEVFILIWNKAPALYKIHGNPVPWLIQLARNRSMDEVRSQDAQSRRHMESYDSLRHDLAEDDHTPEGDFVTVEARAEIQNALSALNPRQRKVIEMIFFGGMSYQDVADTLEVSVGSVSSLIRQAVMKLGAVLRPRMGDAFPAQSKGKKRSDRSSLLWKKLDEAITDLKEEGKDKQKTPKILRSTVQTKPEKRTTLNQPTVNPAEEKHISRASGGIADE